MQFYGDFFVSDVKIENFLRKMLFFNTFAQNIDCGYTLKSTTCIINKVKKINTLYITMA